MQYNFQFRLMKNTPQCTLKVGMAIYNISSSEKIKTWEHEKTTVKLTIQWLYYYIKIDS